MIGDDIALELIFERSRRIRRTGIDHSTRTRPAVLKVMT
jgi:hypothetical protein